MGRVRNFLLAVAASALLADCASPNAGRADEIFKDTPEHWALIKNGFDADISAEKAGRPAPPPETWESRWRGIRDALSTRTQSGQYLYEHADLYIRYIVEQRRAAGLPDIPTFPKSP